MRVNLLSSPLRILQLPFLFLSLLINILVYGRNVDVIHCHWAPVGFVGLMAKPLVGKPVILTLGGTDYRDLPVFFWRYVVEHVDAVISVATETERYLERIGYHKYNVIRTLVDEREFNPAIDAKGLKEEFRVKDEKIVCFVGGIYPIKGPQTLVEAAPYVRERKADVRFFIVGGGVYLEDLKGRAIELGANGYVTFTGPRTDIAKFLKVSTIFTALSPVENTWSNSIAEAMFMGTPLILTDAGYTREFFTHMKDCILVPPNDPKSLAEAIYRLLEDPILQKNLAEGAYDLLDRSGKRREDIVAKTLELYGSVSGMD